MLIKLKGKTLNVGPRLGRALVAARYGRAVECGVPTEDVVTPESTDQDESTETPEVRQKRQYRRRDMSAE